MDDFKVKHYLAEIDHVSDKLKSWSWDIYIAANEKEILGKALAPAQGVEVPWTPLGGHDLLEEMMTICEEQMPKHP